MKRRSDLSVEALAGQQFLDEEAESDDVNESDSTLIANSGKLTFYQKLQLIRMPVKNFKVYLGNDSSVRYNKTDEFYENFMLLSKFKHCSEISIDGQSGVGKTTLMNLMKRKYCKVNIANQFITNGPKYNISPIRSILYKRTVLLSNGLNVCWDRCVYSNAIFQIVSYLCSTYKYVPVEYNLIYPVIDHFVNSVNLKSSIKICMIEKHIPILFLVNSNINQIIKNLVNRGDAKDFYLSTNPNYQLAQLHAYTYFAKLTKNPIIDVGKSPLLRDKLNKEIISLIDYYDDDQYIKYHEFSSTLLKFDDDGHKSLMYRCSKK